MLDDVVARIHASGRRVVVAVSGAGSGAIAALLGVPGASRTVVEALVPYGHDALVDLLGEEPAHACSAETAAAMGRRALERAERRGGGDAALGLAITATVATDRPLRGEHRCHIAVADGERIETVSIVLEKGPRDRAAEEELVARAAVLTLARACGVADAPPAEDVLGGGDRLTRGSLPLDLVSEVVAGTRERITALPDGEVRAAAAPPRAVLPGSFNPLHEGHLELARVAGAALGVPVAFELSVVNADKPALSAREVRRRLGRFAWHGTVEVTRAPMFREKARLLPGCAFVVGADTARRLVDPRYYRGGPAEMTAALDEIVRGGGRFLVAGRVEPDGRFLTLGDVAVPAALASGFTAIPESRFRRDLASSALRAGGSRGDVARADRGPGDRRPERDDHREEERPAGERRTRLRE